MSSVLAFKSMANNTRNKKYFIATIKFISYFFFLGSFFLFFWPRDLLFSRVGIEPNIEYHEPIQLSEDQLDSIKYNVINKPYFELTGEFGLYTAIINTEIKNKGIAYLRVFDAEGNIELASERIPKRTETEIKNTGNQFLKLNFTQYDGVWEHYFIARVELWIKSNSKAEGKKLLEQNFKVDGWIR